MSFSTVRRVGHTPKSPISATISESKSLFKPVLISTSVIGVCLSVVRCWQVQAKRLLHQITIGRVSIKIRTAQRVVAMRIVEVVVMEIVAVVAMGIVAVGSMRIVAVVVMGIAAVGSMRIVAVVVMGIAAVGSMRIVAVVVMGIAGVGSMRIVAVVVMGIAAVGSMRIVAVVVMGIAAVGSMRIVAVVVMGIAAVVVTSEIELVDYRLFQWRRWALTISINALPCNSDYYTFTVASLLFLLDKDLYKFQQSTAISTITISLFSLFFDSEPIQLEIVC